MFKRFEEFVSSHVNRIYVYLVMAGGLMFLDWIEGHHSYGLLVFGLAILDNLGE